MTHSLDGAAALVTRTRQRDAQTFIANASSKHAPSTRCWSFSRLLHSFAYDLACWRVGHRCPLLQTGHPGDHQFWHCSGGKRSSPVFRGCPTWNFLAPPRLHFASPSSHLALSLPSQGLSLRQLRYRRLHSCISTAHGSKRSGPEAWSLRDGQGRVPRR